MAQDPEVVSEAPLAKLEELARLRQQMAQWDVVLARHAPPRPRPWHDIARPEQLIPKDTTAGVHLILAGRGYGKTRMGAEWLAEQAATHPDTEWAAVAPTFRNCRKDCIEYGLLKAFLPGEVDSVNASELIIRLTNGSRIYGYSADRPDRIRGSNLSGAWIDEMASMPRIDDLWNEALQPALRIGENPQVVITTTPRPIKILRKLLDRQDGSVRVVRGATFDNEANLSKTRLARLKADFDGTRLGRQELYGELVDDFEGALWNRDQLDETRVIEAPELARIVVAVDPAVSSGEKSDSTGIIVAGRTFDGHLYILEDLTMKGTPHGCMGRAVSAYHRWHADRIVAEVNNGGDYLEGVLRTVDENVAYTQVRATRGKLTRAEPVAALWEQKRGHIVGVMPDLEDQMCCYTADSKESPDNLDAAIYASVELQVGSSAMIYLSALANMCSKCNCPNTKSAAMCRKCGASLIHAA